MGSVGEGRRQAAVAARRRPEPGGAGAGDRLPLSDRLPEPGRSARPAAPAGARQGRADRRAGARRLPVLHDVGRLARLQRRQAAPAVPRGGGRRFRVREAESRREPRRRHPPRDDRARGDRPRPQADDRREPGVGSRRGDRLGARARVRAAVVHRGADEPRRRRRASQDPRGDRAGAGRDRRDVPEPRAVQAVHRARRDRRRADRRVPARRRERNPRGDADGREIRAAGVPARGRRRAVRIRAASVDDRLRVHFRYEGRARDRVRRSPARAFRRTVRGARRGVHAADGARFLDRDEARIAGAVPVPRLTQDNARRRAICMACVVGIMRGDNMNDGDAKWI
ncbi:hypothetical protein BCEN4_120066 [Burkholderia cenocepacia]|nr:hypothetical protein BCEN4_120066 [Burkholderia cenocepacia]